MTDEARVSSDGFQLTGPEREQLLIAWPWPREAATTAGGFDQVCLVVRTIIAHRLREQARGVAESATDAALAAYSAHERIRCNVGTGGDLDKCGCICGEILPKCCPDVHEAHRRARVLAAVSEVVGRG